MTAQKFPSLSDKDIFPGKCRFSTESDRGINGVGGADPWCKYETRPSADSGE